jgi:putative PEP-CTERM system histidine kinase
MIASLIIAYVAVALSLAAGFAVLLRKARSIAKYCFAAGMGGFALESLFAALWVQSLVPEQAAFWEKCTLLLKSVLPVIWLAFSLTYCRGNAREYLAKSRFLLTAVLVLPLGVTVSFLQQLAGIVPEQASFPAASKILSGLLLVSNVLILMNLERTVRAAVGTMRWRIKFTVLGFAIIFGARVYTESQALLFSRNVLELAYFDSGALLIGCVLIGVGYLRGGFSDVDVYPSRAVIRTSITLLLCGFYLMVVGILAQAVSRFGGFSIFPLESLIVLLGLAVLAVLLLSDRFRQKIQLFISRHFKRPQHDFRTVWTRFTQGMSAMIDEASLCTSGSKMISETFNVLSVSTWLLDDSQGKLFRANSTFATEVDQANCSSVDIAFDELGALRKLDRPFELEGDVSPWVKKLKDANPGLFRTGGKRLSLPLLVGGRCLGLLILADRVNGLPYTSEELDLLKCIGDQMASTLLNIRLAKELLLGKELEGFQTMSAFFVHDLKNAASTLSLMLQNLPIHFDDPAFRKDALEGMQGTVDRINEIVGRLNDLRHDLDFTPAEVDLNSVVSRALGNLNGDREAGVHAELRPLPPIIGDRAKLETVVTNLLLNARDAIGEKGHIIVETCEQNDSVVLSISDDGCGMTPEFIRDSLFRPFRTTKKRGLGIGMFQVRMIVGAHHGSVQVTSRPGAGTTFRIVLPMRSRPK